MKEPFNMRMFWLNIVIIPVFVVLLEVDNVTGIVFICVVLLSYILQTAVKIFEELKKISFYIKNREDNNG